MCVHACVCERDTAQSSASKEKLLKYVIALNKTQSRDERPDGLHSDRAKYRSVSVCLCLAEREWDVCFQRKIFFFL